MLVWPPAPVGNETGEDEDRLDAQFLERTEVSFDALRQSERKTTRRCEEWLSGWRIVIEALKVVCCVDAKPRVGKYAER